MEITSASVKVMRSHDYCHFEVQLAATFGTPLTNSDGLANVNELRKEAARLADKAVEQYKVAKRNAELHESDDQTLGSLGYRAKAVLKTPESERTPGQKAILKALHDRTFRNRPRYDYQDDFEEPDYSEDEDTHDEF